MQSRQVQLCIKIHIYSYRTFDCMMINNILLAIRSYIIDLRVRLGGDYNVRGQRGIETV